MLTNKGFRCDAEIGRINHWHSCNCKAHFRILTAANQAYLHYCTKHAANRQTPRDFTPAPGATMERLNP